MFVIYIYVNIIFYSFYIIVNLIVFCSPYTHFLTFMSEYILYLSLRGFDLAYTETKSDETINLNTQLLSNNLIKLMSRNDVSESTLAKNLDIPYNTVKRLTSGVTTDPRISTLKLIADYFNVSLDDLISNSNVESNKSNISSSPMTVPLYKWEDISNPNFLKSVNLEHWPNWYPVPPMSSEDLKSNVYALESRPSMQPRFPLGTILIIDPESDYIDGDTVLVRMLDNNDVSLRDLVIDPPSYQLLPVVPNSTPISFEKQKHAIIGIVVLTMLHRRKKL